MVESDQMDEEGLCLGIGSVGWRVEVLESGKRGPGAEFPTLARGPPKAGVSAKNMIKKCNSL